MIETNGGMSHIHFWVSDLARSIRFYHEVFGMEERFRAPDGHLASIRTPGTNDSISLNYDPADTRPRGEMGSVDHFGFRLANPDELDEAIRQVIAAGGALVEHGGNGPGRRPTYVADPDGYRIEL
jgi:lactoylglutathione lyase